MFATTVINYLRKLKELEERIIIIENPPPLCVISQLCGKINAYAKSKNFSHHRTCLTRSGIIEKIIEAGLNAVRINMSHGNYDDHPETIAMRGRRRQKLGKPLQFWLIFRVRKSAPANSKRANLSCSKRRNFCHHFAPNQRQCAGSFDQLR